MIDSKRKLLPMFKNVMISGRTPDTWKEGDIALILKKPPQTNINNYKHQLCNCIQALDKTNGEKVSLGFKNGSKAGFTTKLWHYFNSTLKLEKKTTLMDGRNGIQLHFNSSLCLLGISFSVKTPCSE